MKNNKFTDDQVIAIYNLYIYGFSTNEITDMSNGKNIYDVINTKVEKILDSILDYTEDLYYSNHICSNINIEAILQDADTCKKIIDSLKELQERIKQDINSTMSEVFVDNVEQVIKIINNIKKIQQEYDILKQGIDKTSIKEIKELLSGATYTATLKEEVAKQIKVEPIITKEQWQEANAVIKNKN